MQVLSEMLRKHCLTTYFTAWLFCVSLRVVVADLSRWCTPNPSAARGHCGNNLDRMLAAICKNTGYNGYYNKRTVSDPVHNAVAAVHEEDDASKLFLPKTLAHTFLDKRSNMWQGVVCECCYHQCSIREWQEYCKPVDSSLQMTKKALYRPLPEPYARVAAAKFASLRNSKTTHGNSFETSGDRENDMSVPAEVPTDSVAKENEQLRENIYLRSLLARNRPAQ